jgi:hypothetical protein
VVAVQLLVAIEATREVTLYRLPPATDGLESTTNERECFVDTLGC